MRLPATMRAPGPVVRGWVVVVVVGTLLMILSLFFVLAFPWWELGQVVEKTDLPRRQFAFRMAGGWAGKLVAVEADGATWVFGHASGEQAPRDPEEVAPDTLTAKLRDWPSPRYARNCGVRAHRMAPWSAVHRVLESAAQAGETEVSVQMYPHEWLRVVFVDKLGVERTGTRSPVEDHIVLRSVPLADAPATRDRIVDRSQDKDYRPLVRLELRGEPTVEDVLQGLECYVVPLAYGRYGVCLAGVGSR